MVGVTPSGTPVPVEGLVPGGRVHQLQFAPRYPSITARLPTRGQPVREHRTGPLGGRSSLSLSLPLSFSHAAVRLSVWLLCSSRLTRPAAAGRFTGFFLCVWKRSAPERTDGNTSDLQPSPQACVCFQWSFPFPSPLKDAFWGGFFRDVRMEFKPTLPAWTEDPERTLTISLLLSVQTCLVFFFLPLFNRNSVSLVFFCSSSCESELIYS